MVEKWEVKEGEFTWKEFQEHYGVLHDTVIYRMDVDIYESRITLYCEWCACGPWLKGHPEAKGATEHHLIKITFSDVDLLEFKLNDGMHASPEISDMELKDGKLVFNFVYNDVLVLDFFEKSKISVEKWTKGD